MNNDKRVMYIDWLRIVAVILLVPHHGAITFSHLGDSYVQTGEPIGSLYFTIQSTFLNLWFMRLLFFVSGFSTYHSLKKRSKKQFLKERVQKLLVPLLFGCIFLCPLSAFLMVKNTGSFRGNLLHFYPEFFRGFTDKYLGWGHFWFLAYLFVYSLILIACVSCIKDREKYETQISVFLAKHSLLPLLLVVLLEMIFRPFFPGHQNLYADWANFTVYLTFFLLGYIYAIHKPNRPKIFAQLVLCLGASIIFFILNRSMIEGGGRIPLYKGHPYGYKVILAAVHGVAEYSWVKLLIALGEWKLDRGGKIHAYLSRSSFSLYIFHYSLLNVVMYFLLKTSLAPYSIFAIGVIGTYVIFALFYKFVIETCPLLRYVCGVKRSGS